MAREWSGRRMRRAEEPMSRKILIAAAIWCGLGALDQSRTKNGKIGERSRRGLASRAESIEAGCGAGGGYVRSHLPNDPISQWIEQVGMPAQLREFYPMGRSADNRYTFPNTVTLTVTSLIR